MTRYETILNLGDNFIGLMAKKFIPVHILDWKVYYEAYVVQMELQRKNFTKPKKEEAIGIVALQYDITIRTMYSVIAFMEAS
jgi:hypothetical protein